VSRRVSIDTTADVTIGDLVIISEDVTIYTHDHLVDEPLKTKSSPLTIDNGVYIGAKSVILANCNHIGAKAFIGAGSIVTKNVEAGKVVAGNPAREIVK
jgi:hypothetical protein